MLFFFVILTDTNLQVEGFKKIKKSLTEAFIAI